MQSPSFVETAYDEIRKPLQVVAYVSSKCKGRHRSNLSHKGRTGKVWPRVSTSGQASTLCWFCNGTGRYAMPYKWVGDSHAAWETSRASRRSVCRFAALFVTTSIMMTETACLR